MNRKVALITGGSRGLGKEIALCLSKKGIHVLFTYHSNASAAQEVLTQIKSDGQKAKSFKLDTRDISLFDSFISDVKEYLLKVTGQNKIDFLINNAGTGIYESFLETTESQFDEMVNIHFKGVYFLSQKTVPIIQRGGRIINISSGLARFSLPNSSAYASAKGAIEIFTKYLAKELSTQKITANVVAPGAVATDFGGGENKTNEQKRNLVASLTSLGRIGEPEDIGGIISFLCSKDSRWINGQRIEASGGFML